VHKDLDSETRNLLHYEKHTQDLLAAIERIRAVIAAKVEMGRIRFSARHLRDTSGDEEKDDILENAPTLDLLSDLSDIDVVVADDRCLNKLPNWTDASGRSVLATSSLSVLAALRRGGQIDNSAYWRARHRLRAAAYYAVPVDLDELMDHLTNALIVNGELRETPELRVIRESISLARINDVFMPWEEPWLNMVRYAVYKAIRETWLRSIDLDRARAEADWLWSILPNRLEWCLSPEIETVWAAARQQFAIQVALMLTLIEASDERRNGYFAWLQDTVIQPLEDGHPEIWNATLEFLKSYVIRLTETWGRNADTPRRVSLALILKSLPAKLRTSSLLDESFAAKFDFTPRFLLPLGDAGPVDAASLNNALRAAVAGRKTALLVPESGKPFRVQLGVDESGQATIQFKGSGFIFNDADLLSSDAQTRSKALKRVFAAKPLTPAEEDNRRVIARERAFTHREFLSLMTALEATPEALHRRVQMPRPLDVGSILPDEAKYFDRLLAPPGGAPDLRGFIDVGLIKNGRRRIKRHRNATLRRLAYAALWQPLTPFDLLVPIITLSDVEPLLSAADPFSLLFAYELCCKLLRADEAFLRLGTKLLQTLFDPAASMRRCYVFSAIALMTVTNLRQAAKLPDAPLFWTRLAALTHAGVVTDALGEREDAEEFFHWASKQFYPAYRWHTMIDRREAPRWNPDWISPDHLHAEIVGRANQAVQAMPPDQRPQAWASDVEAALGELLKTGKALSAFFPGPFDDFQPETPPANVPPLFKAINEALENASNFSDVSNLFAFAYSAPLPESALAAVLRILSLPLDEPITNDKDDVPFLHLSAHIAGAARSEPIATAVINRCLFAVRNATSDDEIPRFLSIAIEACAAYENADKYRASLGSVATQICFAAPDSAYLSDLETIFDVLALRDEKLIPALARARAIVRTRLRAA
jgi:hypothetical protein